MAELKTNFIDQSIATRGAKRIGIYRSDGIRVGNVELGKWRLPTSGKKLYSFGVLADSHIGRKDDTNNDGKQDANAIPHFEAALDYFRKSDASFICIAGDLVEDGGNKDQWELYNSIIEKHGSGKEVFAISGNHEQLAYSTIYGYAQEYAGMNAMVYDFEHGNDAFIMLGCISYGQETVDKKVVNQRQIYTSVNLQKVHELLEKHKDKRCFVIQHVQPDTTVEDVDVLAAIAEGKNSHIPLSFMAQYENIAAVFHGHAHRPFSSMNNYTGKYLFHGKEYDLKTVSVPALCVYGDNKAEGYIVDVYRDGIHLQGIDFRSREYIPIASYWIEAKER